MKTIRNLLMALLNATIMLAIILVVASTVLIGRISDFRDETLQIVTHAIKPQRERLARISITIDRLEKRLASSADSDVSDIEVALAELRDGLSSISDAKCVASQTMVKQLVQQIGRKLSENPLDELQ